MIVDVIVEGAAVNCDDCNPPDNYGRDAAERTVEWNQHIAAAACAVVDDERCSRDTASAFPSYGFATMAAS